MSCHVEDTAQLSSQDSAAHVCTHVITIAVFHRKQPLNRSVTNENVCIVSAEIQIIKDETVALLDIIKTIFYRRSYKNKLHDIL